MYHSNQLGVGSSRHVSSQNMNVNKTRSLVVGTYKANRLKCLTGWVRQASQQGRGAGQIDAPTLFAHIFPAATNITNETKEGRQVGYIANLLKFDINELFNDFGCYEITVNGSHV